MISRKGSRPSSTPIQIGWAGSSRSTWAPVALMLSSSGWLGWGMKALNFVPSFSSPVIFEPRTLTDLIWLLSRT